jgi:hypothetical protein
MGIINQYKSSKSKKDRDWFLQCLLFFLTIIAMIVIVMLQEEGSRDYYVANNGLLIMNLITFLIFLVGKTQKTRSLYKSFSKLATRKIALSLPELGNIFLLSSFVISVLSFILILDLSFMQNYGIRIGGAASVIVFKIIRILFESKT